MHSTSKNIEIIKPILEAQKTETTLQQSPKLNLKKFLNTRSQLSNSPTRGPKEKVGLIEDPDGARSKSLLSQHSNMYPANQKTPYETNDTRINNIIGLEGVKIVPDGGKQNTLYKDEK